MATTLTRKKKASTKRKQSRKKKAETKLSDARGRISLGADYANCTFLVEDDGDRLILRPARVIPENEAWLYANPKALAGVLEGLAQARRREFVKGPVLERALRRGERMMGRKLSES